MFRKPTERGRLPTRSLIPDRGSFSASSSSTCISRLPSEYLTVQGVEDNIQYPDSSTHETETAHEVTEFVDLQELPEAPQLSIHEIKAIKLSDDTAEFQGPLEVPQEIEVIEIDDDEVEFAALPEAPQLPRSLSVSSKRRYYMDDEAADSAKKSKVYF